jgi:hypothetical protein
MKNRETALMSEAKAAGGTDNITFQMLHISHSPHRKSIFESKSVQPHLSPKNKRAGNSRLISLAAMFLLVAASIMTGIWIGRKTNSPEEMEKDAEGTLIQQADTVEQEISVPDGDKPLSFESDPMLPKDGKNTRQTGRDNNGIADDKKQQAERNKQRKTEEAEREKEKTSPGIKTETDSSFNRHAEKDSIIQDPEPQQPPASSRLEKDPEQEKETSPSKTDSLYNNVREIIL